MIRTLTLTLAAAAALLSTAAHAQTAGAQNQVDVLAIAGGGGSSDTHQSGHVYTTPNVGGSYFAGANNCLVGVGAGGSGGPVGFSINWGHDSVSCERRMDAAAFYSMAQGTHDERMYVAAVNRMCDGDENKAALIAAGVPCPGVKTAQPAVAQASRAPVTLVTYAPPPAAPARPAYCDSYGRGAVAPRECAR